MRRPDRRGRLAPPRVAQPVGRHRRPAPRHRLTQPSADPAFPATQGLAEIPGQAGRPQSGRGRREWARNAPRHLVIRFTSSRTAVAARRREHSVEGEKARILYAPVLVLAALAAGSRRLGGGELRGAQGYNRAKLDSYECGIEPTRSGRRRPLSGEVLHHRDDVHRLRHRDRVPLPAGGHFDAMKFFGLSKWSCSSSRSSSRTPTCGAAAASTGTRENSLGIEEKLPSGVLLTTVEGVAGDMRKSSLWPVTFGLACCAIEMMAAGGPHTTWPASARRSSAPARARPTS